MIYPTSDGKGFSFYRCYIHSVVNRFGNDFLFLIYMRDQDGCIILDISICIVS